MLHHKELTSEAMMTKDPAIKLFGKTIALPPDKAVSGSNQKQSSMASSASQDSKDGSGGEFVGIKQDGDSINDAVSVEVGNDSISDQKSSGKDEPVESKVSEEKSLAKPNKLLPCPRCNSMETKFCYYNNYNVGQPRHFCKKCQRYWTAGGTMRNVPVGSGRRKAKHSSVLNYQHITVSDSPQNGMQFSSWMPNGILIFGSDTRLPESVASTPSPVETSQNRSGTEFLHHPVSSSGIASVSPIKGNNDNVQESGFPNPPWPPQNSPTAFVPPCFPVTFYPAAPYWGCAVPGPWNMPFFSRKSSSDLSRVSTSSGSSSLGKHSIDGSMIRPSNSPEEETSEKKSVDRRVLVPKALRIDDPNEAAKSSVWSSLGIKNQKANPINGATFFKPFHSKADMNNSMNNSLVLQANPAAMSRALNFREAAKCD